MKWYRLICATASVILLSKIAMGADTTQYVCVSDETTGFFFENGKWGQASFRDSRKFILKEVDAQSAGPSWVVGEKIWELVETGMASPIAFCSDWTNLIKRERSNAIRCSGLYKAEFDKSTLRFLLSYFVGYTDGADNNENTPTLSIGKCSPL